MDKQKTRRIISIIIGMTLFFLLFYSLYNIKSPMCQKDQALIGSGSYFCLDQNGSLSQPIYKNFFEENIERSIIFISIITILGGLTGLVVHDVFISVTRED